MGDVIDLDSRRPVDYEERVARIRATLDSMSQRIDSARDLISAFCRASGIPDVTKMSEGERDLLVERTLAGIPERAS